MYVHYGKTPPCVNKIINQKLKKLVYSIDDKDLRTAGKSFKILKSNKKRVIKNILNKKSKLIYKIIFTLKIKIFHIFIVN